VTSFPEKGHKKKLFFLWGFWETIYLNTYRKVIKECVTIVVVTSLTTKTALSKKDTAKNGVKVNH
jgi:hypothetical protein